RYKPIPLLPPRSDQADAATPRTDGTMAPLQNEFALVSVGVARVGSEEALMIRDMNAGQTVVLRAEELDALLRARHRDFAPPVPTVGADDGLLTVEACGLCGTDWDFYTRQRGAHLGPLILGHEIVGRVLAVGEGAARRWHIKTGDCIAVEEFLPCGQCELCKSGRPALCEATDSRSEKPFLRYGSTPVDVPPGLWGGFSEILYLHPRALVHHVPDDLSPDLATLFVPVSNGIRGTQGAEGERSPRTRLSVGGGGTAAHRLAPLPAGAHPHARIPARTG